MIEGLRAQDPAALEALESQYGRLVRSWARGEGADVDDVVQEVLLRAWRSGPRLEPDTFLPSWLKTVTTNALKDRWRASGRRPSIPMGLEINCTTPDPTPDSTSRIAVEQIMEGLVPRERDVLNMLYLSDLSLHDAAQQLGLSEEATKSLAARARRRLRGRIEQLVAMTPASALALLVGRAAEATTGIWRAVGALGAAAAAATALAAGTVTYHRAHTPSEAPTPAIVETVPTVGSTPATTSTGRAPAPASLGELLTSPVTTSTTSTTEQSATPPATGLGAPQGGNVHDPVATPPAECPHVEGDAPDDRGARDRSAAPDGDPRPPAPNGEPAPSGPGCSDTAPQPERSEDRTDPHDQVSSDRRGGPRERPQGDGRYSEGSRPVR